MTLKDVRARVTMKYSLAVNKRRSAVKQTDDEMRDDKIRDDKIRDDKLGKNLMSN